MPASPLFGSRTNSPSETPAGMRAIMLSVRRARPVPWQVRQARGRCRPLPPHAVHVRENTMCPRTLRTAPDPWHIAHAAGADCVTPRPAQGAHTSLRLMVSATSAPRNASLNDNVTS